MNIRNKTIWQCACGEVALGMDYSDVCLKRDVMMIGPGNKELGAYPECMTKIKEFGSKKVMEITWNTPELIEKFIPRIARDVEDGDIAVLKHGRSTVKGVGVVVGKYLYDRRFGNDGNFKSIGFWEKNGEFARWDVSHCRRVRWLWKEVHNFSRNILSMDRISRLNAYEAKRWLETLQIAESAMNRPLAEL